MTNLFDPLTVRGVLIPNRIWMAPMGNWSADPAHPGMVTDAHIAHYGARASGGAGMVVVEATAVADDGRNTVYDMGLWHDSQVRSLARLATVIRDGGAVPGIQLNHAGREVSSDLPWADRDWVPEGDGGWKGIGPSAIAAAGYPAPRAMTQDDIDRVIGEFASAAHRAAAAGFEVLEIHAAHGYLIHEFLSPLSNHREDAYGCGFDGRVRLVCEVVDAVRADWPERFPLLVRISATDWVAEHDRNAPGSWTVEQSIALSSVLQARGVDLIDVSSGGLVPATVPAHSSYQTDIAAQIRRESGVPVVGVGRINDAHTAHHLITEGNVDAVMIGRALLRHPSWPNSAASTLGHQPRYLRRYAHYLDKQDSRIRAAQALSPVD